MEMYKRVVTEVDTTAPVPTGNLMATKQFLAASALDVFEARLAAGFAHNGTQFPGNLLALALLGIGKHASASITYPLPVPTIDGTDYDVPNKTDFDALFEAMRAVNEAAFREYTLAIRDIKNAASEASAIVAHDIYVGG